MPDDDLDPAQIIRAFLRYIQEANGPLRLLSRNDDAIRGRCMMPDDFTDAQVEAARRAVRDKTFCNGECDPAVRCQCRDGALAALRDADALAWRPIEEADRSGDAILIQTGDCYETVWPCNTWFTDVSGNVGGGWATKDGQIRNPQWFRSVIVPPGGTDGL